MQTSSFLLLITIWIPMAPISIVAVPSLVPLLPVLLVLFALAGRRAM